MKKHILLVLSCLFLSGCEGLGNNSSTDNSGNDISVEAVDVDYYRSLVQRDKIVYSEDFVNDPSVDVSALEVYQINDTHGAYYDDEEIVGISRVATTIKNTTDNPYGVVKIGNGDLLQGTAFSNLLLGEPGIAALNEMDFDAFVIGNHEFDWGIEKLAIYKDGDLSNGELQCDFLGANIVDGNNQRPDWIKPYTVVEKGNVKVGIIGIIGDTLESSISKVALGDYQFTESIDAVKKYSKILEEEEKVDVIILSEHNHNEAINQVYVNECKIDLIINGHDHQYIEEYVTRYDGVMVPVIESNTKNISIGKATLLLDENKNMESFELEHFKPSLYEQDTSLQAIMDIYYDVTSVYEQEVIGYNKGGMDKKILGISTCTYIANKYDADVACMNIGGVRAALRNDNITNKDVYEALPFDNELYIAYVSGKELKSLVNGSGLYFNNCGMGKGTYVETKDIKDSETYKIVAVDYVATGYFKFQEVFDEEHGLELTGDYIRDCATENIKLNYEKK